MLLFLLSHVPWGSWFIRIQWRLRLSFWLLRTKTLWEHLFHGWLARLSLCLRTGSSVCWVSTTTVGAGSSAYRFRSRFFERCSKVSDGSSSASSSSVVSWRIFRMKFRFLVLHAQFEFNRLLFWWSFFHRFLCPTSLLSRSLRSFVRWFQSPASLCFLLLGRVLWSPSRGVLFQELPPLRCFLWFRLRSAPLNSVDGFRVRVMMII